MLPRYLQIQTPTGTGLRWPALADAAELLTWATRESELLMVLVVGCAVVATASGRRLASIVVSLSLVFVVVSAGLGGDPSYRSRVAYLIPIVVALGSAPIWGAVERRFASPPPSRRSARTALLIAPLLAVWAVSTLGFNERLSLAANHYQRLSVADLAVTDALRAEPGGLVATSWATNDYGEGLPNSWLIEGLAARRAAGPTNPALSTIESQRTLGATMQQLFAGEVGLQNRAVQVAFGPPGARADPAIAVEMGDFFYAVMYASVPTDDSGVGSVTIGDDYTLDASSARFVQYDAAGRAVVATEVGLDGADITITHRRLGEVSDRGRWSLWLWPAYGVGWQGIDAAPDRVAFSARPRIGRFLTVDDEARLTVTVGEGAELRYHEQEMRYDVQALEVRAAGTDEVTIRITVDDVDTGGETLVFDERSILAEHDVRDVIVWRDTGWLERFEHSRCYELEESGHRIVRFSVSTACRGAEERPRLQGESGRVPWKLAGLESGTLGMTCMALRPWPPIAPVTAPISA